MLKRKFSELDVDLALGNNALDGEALDEFNKRLKTCEERLYAAENFNKTVRISASLLY